MPAALSDNTRPANLTKPESGRRKPAMTERTEVFPLPDGPTRAMTEAGEANSSSSAKPLAYRSRHRHSSRFTALPLPLQVLTGPQRQASQEHRDPDQDPHPA